MVRLSWPCLLPLVLSDASMPVVRDTTFVGYSPRSSQYPQYSRLAGPWYSRLPLGEEIETIWHRPPGDVKGIVFFLHECGHQATDLFFNVAEDGWWMRDCDTSNFNECLGLSDHVLFRQEARRLGYLVAASSGGSGRQSCWREDNDINRAKIAIDHIGQQEQLAGVPLIIVGVSSSKFMKAFVRSHPRGLSCIVSVNAALGVAGDHPAQIPTIFQHMPRDVATASKVTRDFLQRGGFGLAPATADKVIQALTAAGHLDASGLLKRNPRLVNWPMSVLHLEREVGGFGEDTSKLGALLHAAYAEDDFFGGHAERILRTCESMRAASS
eukprot:TRINITY_DN65586_c0_g1_i2.p1 TRINITY_DN65586_c0_g1~~TRINITY_DN65586_c0_g1_i2.p1  ORF type:complete len:326 (+),score=57.23 TRINITY_DN65586_c0_g1_i2:69-1046(+)